MIRVTFEIPPGGSADLARTIGVMEICNLKTHADGTADYGVAMKKCPPYRGALREAWRKGRVSCNEIAINAVTAGDDESLLTAMTSGHHRTKRGVYDLLFRAMVACGLDKRNPLASDAETRP